MPVCMPFAQVTSPLLRYRHFLPALKIDVLSCQEITSSPSNTLARQSTTRGGKLYLGELHISDLIFLVVMSPTCFLLYAYLRKDHFWGDGISPTFCYSKNYRHGSSPFFSFSTNITEVWLASDCELPHFPPPLTPPPSPPLTPPLTPSPTPTPSLTPLTPLLTPLTPPLLLFLLLLLFLFFLFLFFLFLLFLFLLLLPPRFWTDVPVHIFFRRYALFLISEMCQLDIFADISEMYVAPFIFQRSERESLSLLPLAMVGDVPQQKPAVSSSE